MRTILIPVDDSPLAAQAMSPACRLDRHWGASLVLLHAAPRPQVPGTGAPAPAAVVDVEASLRALRQDLVRDGFEVQLHLYAGDLVGAILRAAERYGADLIAMSMHRGGSGLRRLLQGSELEQVLHRSPLPVLLTRPTAQPRARDTAPLRRILVPLDGTRFAEAALAYLVQEGLVGTAELVLLRVISPPHAPMAPGMTAYAAEVSIERVQQDAAQRQAEARRYLDGLAASYLGGIPHRTQVVVDHAARAILDVAAVQGIDLVAMATHDRTGLGRLQYGHVDEHVLHHATVPVLLLHGTAAAGLPEHHPAHAGRRLIAAGMS